MAFNSLDSVDSKEDIVIMMLVASVCHNAPAVKLTVDQVWFLTQFYSVDFSQSRIGVKKVRLKQTHNEGLQLFISYS